MSTLQFPLWGKAGRDMGDTHHSALLAHILAVAACFRVLTEDAVIQQRLTRLLNAPWEQHRTLLVWLAALHDVGKVDHRFQRKRADVREVLLGREAEPAFTGSYHHGEEGFHLFRKEALSPLQLPTPARRHRPPEQDLLKGLFQASCAHHGYYIQSGSNAAGSPDTRDKQYAEQLSHALFNALELALGPIPRNADGYHQLPLAREGARLSLLHYLGGLIALADWLGSDEMVFPFIPCPEFEARYPDAAGLARLFHEYSQTARQRIKAISLFTPLQVDSATDSARATLLGDWPPRPVQQWILDEFQPAPGPGLLLIEAPMGDGKTEAALLAAGKWIDAGQAHGLVFALPTQAATNQNHQRLFKIGSEWFNYSAALLHGKAALLKFMEQDLRGHRQRTQDETGAEASLHFSEWIGDSSKRAFLHPICAATVDQLELAALFSKHSFVRAAALARHVVVIDEIHAYDAYMETILRSLLQFLGATATPTVLLSATLPPVARKLLLNAYARGADVDTTTATLDNTGYPLITRLDHGGIRQTAIALPTDAKPRAVTFATLDGDRAEANALACAREGACVCLLCNTVGSALDRFERLQAIKDDSVTVSLFHARFRFSDRAAVEKNVLQRFGNGEDATIKGRRGQILIATQVVEQSLDLDFDYMLSELAPIDLLLQRAGRMHRHRRWDEHRPASCSQPQLGIIIADHNTAGWYQATLKVYAESEHVLRETLQWVETHTTIDLPNGIARAVREVYGETTVANSLAEKRRYKAGLRILDHDTKNLGSPMAGREISSATRDAEESIALLIVLESAGDEDSDALPVWDGQARRWRTEPLPQMSTPIFPVNPDYRHTAALWSLNLRCDGREYRQLREHLPAEPDLAGFHRLACQVRGEILKLPGGLRYSITRGLHAST